MHMPYMCFLSCLLTIGYYNIIGSESVLTAIDAGGETAATPFNNIEGS